MAVVGWSWLKPVLDVIGSVATGGLSYMGAQQQNEFNERIMHEQMEFQREQTSNQMAFQERMSNTAFQRAVQDMVAAGINPMLAASLGGASTPQGSSSAGSTMRAENALGAAVSSALQARLLSQQIEQMKIQNKLMQAELPEKEAGAEIYSGKKGSWFKGIKEFLSPLLGIGNTVSKFIPK